MTLPVRKPNRLPGYDYSSDGAYFVTLCTKERRSCLGHIPRVGADAHIGPSVELTELGEIVESYLRRIPGIQAYVIMPNHIHMILVIGCGENGPMWASAPTQTISQRISSFKTLVTKAAGRPIWQRSFYDHIIRSEQEYLQIWDYINTNPDRWLEDRFYIGE